MHSLKQAQQGRLSSKSNSQQGHPSCSGNSASSSRSRRRKARSQASRHSQPTSPTASSASGGSVSGGRAHSAGSTSCSSKVGPLRQRGISCTADSSTCHVQQQGVPIAEKLDPSQPPLASASRDPGSAAAPPGAPHQGVDQLNERLQQLQAERQVAEDLAEQMMWQAEALMAEKARVQAENCTLQKERENLLERLEYMEQATVAEHHLSPSASPEKEALLRAQLLQQQLHRAQQEKEELLELLETTLEGLNLNAFQEQKHGGSHEAGMRPAEHVGQ